MSPETINQNHESSDKNIKEIDRVKKKVTEDLGKLEMELFYNKDGETIKYNINTVRQYLTQIQNNFQQCNCVTGIMAVQILLESQGYDVGKIDGIVGAKTLAQIKKFQKDNGIKENGIINNKTVQALLGLENNGGGDTGGNSDEAINDNIYTRSSQEERETECRKITMDNIEKIIDGYVQYNECIDSYILKISDQELLNKAISYMKSKGKQCFYLYPHLHKDKQVTANLKVFAENNLVENIALSALDGFGDEQLEYIQQFRNIDSSIYLRISDRCLSTSSFKHIQMLFNPAIIWINVDDMKTTYTEGSLTIDTITSNLATYQKITTANNHIFYNIKEEYNNNCYLKFNDYDLKCNHDYMVDLVTALDERVNKAIEAKDFKDYNFGGISGDLEMSKTGFSLKDEVVFDYAEGKLKSRGVDPEEFLKFINEYIAEAKKQN